MGGFDGCKPYDLDSSGGGLPGVRLDHPSGDVISALSQKDSKLQPGVVSGWSPWMVSREADTAHISHYVVYMAEDEARTGLQALGQAPVGMITLDTGYVF